MDTLVNTTRQLALVIAVGLSLATSACGGDGIVLPNEGRPAAITIESGDGQNAAAGAMLGDPLVIRVVDALGRSVQGQTVVFTVQSGGGTVDPGSVRTGSDGRASVTWTLGAAAGQQQVQALVQGDGAPPDLSVSFTATALTGAGTALVIAQGDNQTAPVGSALADSLVVRVVDAFGNPVSGVEVQWTVDAGGSISPASVTTGADGLAGAERVLGNTAGTQTAQAAADGIAGVTFTSTAVPANPTVLKLVSGDGQTGSVGNPLAEPLVVRLEDANGNGVGGQPITFVAGQTAGSVDPVNTTTDPNGLASTVWTLGQSLGTKTVNGIYSGLPPVAFTATAVAATPTKLVFTQPPQITAAGASFSPSIQVAIQDAGGNTVTSATNAVTLAIGANPAGGTLSGTVTVNAVNGVASFANVSIDKTGSGYTLLASADGLTGAESPAFDIVPVQVATVLTIVQDTPDPSVIGVPLTVVWNLTSTGTAAITGNVTVTVNGTTDTCSAPAALGSGTCDVVITANGSRRLTASFPGDANYRSASDNESHQVKGTTSTSLSSSPNPSTVGQSVTFTAHVATSGGSTGTPGGSVQFLDGTMPIGTKTIDASGDAELAVNSLTEGSHQITAVYQGSSTFESSTSSPVTQVVNPEPNAAPSADDDGYSTNEDGGALNVDAASGVLNGDSDPNGDALTAVLETGPAHAADGGFTLNPDGSFSYTPAADFNGSDSFTYHASDGSSASGTATVTITVNPVNDAPSFTSVGDVTASVAAGPYDQPWVTGTSPGPANETDQTLSFVVTLVDPLDALKFNVGPSVTEQGHLTFTPSVLASGDASVSVHVQDSGGTDNGGVNTSPDQTFTITFTP